MNEMEHLLNVYASKAAKNSVAEFIGYCNVGYEEASRNLTEGLWLVRACTKMIRTFNVLVSIFIWGYCSLNKFVTVTKGYGLAKILSFTYFWTPGQCLLSPVIEMSECVWLGWQIWRYEGSKTLSYYLKRRDCLSTIAADMEIPEDAVVPTVMKQIFENLQVLPRFVAAGLSRGPWELGAVSSSACELPSCLPCLY
jgi:hypothetical protein